MALSIGFWALAAVAVFAALMVVTLQSVFRAALSLVLALVAVAGIYVTLGADFVAGVQVLVYVGAISILLIIGIMLTRDVQQGNPSSRLAVPAFLTALVLFGVLTYVFLSTTWRTLPVSVDQPTTAVIAGSLFDPDGYLITIEIAGMVLLAAILGAIALAREK